MSNGGTVVEFSAGMKVGPDERYEIVRICGRGGMGVVYEAVDHGLDRPRKVALKQLNKVFAGDPRHIDNIRREVALARDLGHPNIVRVYEYIKWRDEHLVIMEWMAGGTLVEELYNQEEKRFTPDQALKLLKPIAAALDYAHKRKPPVVHRDLKPLNVMLTEDGDVKVTDFGLSREVKESVTRVTGKDSSGSLEYMPFEQYMGDPPSPSHDIYALGITAYELLNGQPPFTRGDIGIQHERKTPATIEGIPKELMEVLLKCLAKDEKERYTSTGEFIEAFEAGLKGNLLTLTQKSKVEANLKKEPLVKKAAEIESKNGDIKVKEIEKQPFYLSKKIGNKIILSFASVFALIFVFYLIINRSEPENFLENLESKMKTKDKQTSGSVDKYQNKKTVKEKRAKKPNLSSTSESMGLVAYYPLNGNAYDESGNGNDGIVKGAVLSTDRFGNQNSAYSFDGVDDKINLPFSSEVLSGELSIVAWVYREKDLLEWHGLQGIISNLEPSSAGLTIGADKNEKLKLSMWTSDRQIEFYAEPELHKNDWEFIAMVYNGANLSGYINGQQFQEESGSGNLIGQKNFEIGNDTYSASKLRYWGGKIDDIHFYNRALTEIEINDLYCEGGWCEQEDGIVGYYPFNGNANDESGNGNDGIVKGAALSTDRFGNENSAYSFDGVDDWINTNNTLINGSFTMTSWIKTSQQSEEYALGKGVILSTTNEHGNIGNGFILKHVGENVGFGKYPHDRQGWDISSATEGVGININNDKWRFIVGTWDGSINENGVKLYIDGEFYSGTSSMSAMINHDFDMKIGYSFDGPHHFYHKGQIDDIRIYNRALTKTEIEELYCKEGWCER